MRTLSPLLGLAIVLSFGCLTYAEEPAKTKVLANLHYKEDAALSDYEKERCQLDVYLPTEGKDFPVLIWFHGGGLTKGDKKSNAAFAQSLAKDGIAVVSANYRLSPKVKYPAYLEDAAAAVAWSRKNLPTHGADAKRIFVGGHSAGAYMALMIGMDERYLRAAGLALSDLAGLVPVSGQTMTHFTIREERGLNKDAPIADEAAPIHHVKKDTLPMILLMGDKDWPARWEENLYFAELLRTMKNERAFLKKIEDRDHGSIFSELAKPGDPGRESILAFIASNGKVADWVR